MENKILHEVVITAIIIKKRKYLIIRRSKNKKRFPGQWTVPGGRLETADYLDLPKQTKDYWYNVLESALIREVKEEVGLTIKNIDYLISLATIHKDGNPSIVISCSANYESGDVILQKEEADDFAWVSLSDAKKYDLIDGIYDEIAAADAKLSGKQNWGRLK